MDIAKIGRYIAEKRKRARLTQRQLADKLGKSDKSVSKWERGICLPDVSVYMELREILEISVNEFLAGEDISEDSVREKSDETLLQVSKEGKNKQKFLRRIIVALCIILTGLITVIAVIACKKMRQPRNFIEEVSPDSAEMKTAELMSGADGVMMFRYKTKDNYKCLFVYLSEYQFGKRVSHEKIAEISFNGTESTETGMIVVVPNFEKFSASLIVADNYTKYTTENPILNDVEDRKYYGRSATSINHTCPIDFGTEQGLAALVYGKNGLSMLPIQDISGDNLNTENDYMYYYSVEFTK